MSQVEQKKLKYYTPSSLTKVNKYIRQIRMANYLTTCSIESVNFVIPEMTSMKYRKIHGAEEGPNSGALLYEYGAADDSD